METILIIGATGMLGIPVAKKFKTRFNIRLLFRNIEKSNCKSSA